MIEDGKDSMPAFQGHLSLLTAIISMTAFDEYAGSLFKDKRGFQKKFECGGG